MTNIDKNKPICDTDIWIKNCKCKERFKKDIIFNLYSGIYMADAVRQELARTDRDSYKEEFELGNRKVKECYKDGIISIIRHKSLFFSDEQSKAVEKEFVEKGILYDNIDKRFIGCRSGLGEQVTIIYAAMLEIPIILSDDAHCKIGINLISQQYPYLNVINLRGLVNESKIIDENDKERIINEINRPLSDLIENNTIKKSFEKFGKKKVV